MHVFLFGVGVGFVLMASRAGQQKAADLVARCSKNGFWRWDKNFPDDQEEVEYLVYDGIEFSAEDSVTNTMQLESSKERRARSKAMCRKCLLPVLPLYVARVSL